MGEEDEDELFTDDGSVDIEDVHDVMFVHSQSQSDWNGLEGAQPMSDTKTATKKSKEKETVLTKKEKKAKGLPVRGRRLKTMNSGSSKNRFSVDVKNKHQKAAGTHQRL